MKATLTIPLQSPAESWANFKTLLPHIKALFPKTHSFCGIVTSAEGCDFCPLDENTAFTSLADRPGHGCVRGTVPRLTRSKAGSTGSEATNHCIRV